MIPIALACLFLAMLPAIDPSRHPVAQDQTEIENMGVSSAPTPQPSRLPAFIKEVK